jgi:hypothetical protein
MKGRAADVVEPIEFSAAILATLVGYFEERAPETIRQNCHAHANISFRTSRTAA